MSSIALVYTPNSQNRVSSTALVYTQNSQNRVSSTALVYTKNSQDRVSGTGLVYTSSSNSQDIVLSRPLLYSLNSQDIYWSPSISSRWFECLSNILCHHPEWQSWQLHVNTASLTARTTGDRFTYEIGYITCRGVTVTGTGVTSPPSPQLHLLPHPAALPLLTVDFWRDDNTMTS